MLICELKDSSEELVEGVFQVRNVLGQWELSDLSGGIPFENHALETIGGPYEPKSGDLLEAGLVLERDNEGKINELIGKVSVITSLERCELALLPSSKLPKAELVLQMSQLIDSLRIASLRDFVRTIFADEELALAYATVPASRNHHHNYPGGLLEHSLEMAKAALRDTGLLHLEPFERELVATACLVHDLGKVVTHNTAAKSLTNSSSHEVIGVELMANAMKQLEEDWPDGANSLRTLLNEFIARNALANNPMVLRLRHLDAESSHNSAFRMAYEGQPIWKRYAKLGNGGRGASFWRPAPMSVAHRRD